ncbi:nucleoside phosphorylase [Aureisphaera galaxeae]|uniref:nucleoside phosphorylase n=1 Tax=Aureisphaera galaxeae TaxID=1538023 RepID=UPI002350DBC8|nr:nucleoside phosphorylase [Aureisphaera galaxeae]MDC8004213.1 nucleoside phosphorylase [Aureisphaera galaxeae]
MRIPESELILNQDGSIYHLHLHPEDIAETIITVGDPDRVSEVTRHFDTIEFTKQKREFKTQTGSYKGKRMTVISTGIGTDNIDIVFNELDALANIDLETRTTKETFTQLDFIRIGTSGAIQPDIAVDSFLVSAMAIGFDNLVHFYGDHDYSDDAFINAFMNHLQWSPRKSEPYSVAASPHLLALFPDSDFIQGITATNVGFYGPQGRKLRLALEDDGMNKKLESFRYNDKTITNLEMETSGIYAMASLLGHNAVSLNAILANRALGTFSDSPSKAVDSLIINVLDRIVA